MKETIKPSSTGISVLGVIFIVLAILKLTGHITWSWWFVTAPLWSPVAIVFTLLIAVVIAFPILLILQNFKKRRRH